MTPEKEMEVYGITGKYAHFCPDWDGLPIDETCSEFECCVCFSGEKPEVPKESEET